MNTARLTDFLLRKALMLRSNPELARASAEINNIAMDIGPSQE